MSGREPALLVLSDGTSFEGEAVGALRRNGQEVATGELVFNTAMTGYQEIVTDPSYAGQVIAFTYPHIGNYGISPDDAQSRQPYCRGIVVREIAGRPSSWRAASSLEEYLVASDVPGLTGIDTRRLTRHVRDAGAMPCAFGFASYDELLDAARREPGTVGMDLVAEVTTASPYEVASHPDIQRRVVAYDFGIKTAILEQLSRVAAVEVVPASTSAADVLARGADGVFLSNGPGDPAALSHLAAEIEKLIGEVPIFGICLGHQLLGSALGGRTFKLPFGHHGANQPVKRLSSGVVEITSENHGYAIEPGSVRSADVSHLNLNDGVVEGIACKDVPAFSVQYHPEAGPGPHDARYLFAAFAELMDAYR